MLKVFWVSDFTLDLVGRTSERHLPPKHRQDLTKVYNAKNLIYRISLSTPTTPPLSPWVCRPGLSTTPRTCTWTATWEWQTCCSRTSPLSRERERERDHITDCSLSQLIIGEASLASVDTVHNIHMCVDLFISSHHRIHIYIYDEMYVVFLHKLREVYASVVSALELYHNTYVSIHGLMCVFNSSQHSHPTRTVPSKLGFTNHDVLSTI